MRHQVTRQLTRFYNVLYVELPFGSRTKRDELSLINERMIAYKPARLIRGLGRVWDNIEHFHKYYNARLTKKIERVIKDLNYESSLLVNFQFNFPQIMKSPVFVRKLYICNDEFSCNTEKDWKRELLWKHERDVAMAADACLCVSAPLASKIGRANSKTELFLPGHEFDIDESGARLRPGRTSDKIRVCFMGYINGRIRFDWLAALLQDSRMELTLVGPVQAGAALEELEKFVNIRLLPPLGGKDLQHFLNSQDVLVMPYDTDDEAVRAATAPNKLFQYIACGRPVVISDMPAFMTLPNKFVYRAKNACEFGEFVHMAFTQDSDKATQARLDLAANHTWVERGNRLRDLLEPQHCVSGVMSDTSNEIRYTAP
jgi:glycosyltransferase involved in cell wall biosynthesis